MKKNKSMLKSLSLAALFSLIGVMSSCDAIPDSSDQSSDINSSDSGSSSSSSSQTGAWNSEEEALIKKYCGEVLPYPNGMVSGTVTVNELRDTEQNFTFLEIYDESAEFSLRNYYKLLEEKGWSTIVAYGDNKVQYDTSGTPFVELTKASVDGKEGYDIIYSFDSRNVIHCYTEMSGKATSNTSWSDTEAATIKKAMTVDLPFIALGEDYWVSVSNFNYLQIYDVYVEDLTHEYAKLLQEDGFLLSRPLSSQYGLYYLVKYLDGGAILEATLYYYGGNTLNFSYSGSATEYDSWPTELTDQIKESSGVDIPQFEIAEGGKYLGYKKGDTYFIYTYDLKNGYNYETYSLNELRNPFLTWEETVSFIAYNLTNYDGETIGYMAMIDVTEPTSTFVSDWPSAKIEEVIKDVLGIEGVSLPDFDASSFPVTGKKIKYSVLGKEYYDQAYAYYYADISEYPSYYGLENPTEEEIVAEAARLARLEEGITVSVFDVNSKASEVLASALYNAGWYEYTNTYGYFTYEDPTGKLAISFDSYANPSHDYEGVTEFFIHPGSENAHTPEFHFKEKSYNVAIGWETDLYLGLVKNMYPYDVSYSSSDETGGISIDEKGVLTVKDTVAEGTKATITASITLKDGSTITTSCEVVAIVIKKYVPSGVIDKINALVETAGYTATVVHERLIDYLTINFGSELTVNEIKELAEKSFVLDDFSKGDSVWEEKEDNVDGKDITGQFISYDFRNEYCWILVEYFIYTVNGNTYLRISAY